MYGYMPNAEIYPSVHTIPDSELKLLSGHCVLRLSTFLAAVHTKTNTNHHAVSWLLSAGPCRTRRPLCILCCHMNTPGLLMKP